jgi:hypothetical protein
MGAIDSFVAALEPYALWIALLLLVVGTFAAIKTGLSGGVTAGLLWLGILFVLVAFFLFFTGEWLWGAGVILIAVLLLVSDSFHERRLVRRGRARMRD